MDASSNDILSEPWDFEDTIVIDFNDLTVKDPQVPIHVSLDHLPSSQPNSVEGKVSRKSDEINSDDIDLSVEALPKEDIDDILEAELLREPVEASDSKPESNKGLRNTVDGCRDTEYASEDSKINEKSSFSLELCTNAEETLVTKKILEDNDSQNFEFGAINGQKEAALSSRCEDGDFENAKSKATTLKIENILVVNGGNNFCDSFQVHNTDFSNSFSVESSCNDGDALKNLKLVNNISDLKKTVASVNTEQKSFRDAMEERIAAEAGSSVSSFHTTEILATNIKNINEDSAFHNREKSPCVGIESFPETNDLLMNVDISFDEHKKVSTIGIVKPIVTDNVKHGVNMARDAFHCSTPSNVGTNNLKDILKCDAALTNAPFHEGKQFSAGMVMPKTTDVINNGAIIGEDSIDSEYGTAAADIDQEKLIGCSASCGVLTNMDDSFDEDNTKEMVKSMITDVVETEVNVVEDAIVNVCITSADIVQRGCFTSMMNDDDLQYEGSEIFTVENIIKPILSEIVENAMANREDYAQKMSSMEYDDNSTSVDVLLDNELDFKTEDIAKPLFAETINNTINSAMGHDESNSSTERKENDNIVDSNDISMQVPDEDVTRGHTITTVEIVKPLISELIEGAMDIAQGLNCGKYVEIREEERAIATEDIVKPLISELVEGAMDIAQGLNCGKYVEIYEDVPQERAIATEDIVKPIISELVEGAMDIAQGLNCGKYVEIYEDVPQERAIATEDIVKPLISELVEGALDIAQGLNFGEYVETHKDAPQHQAITTEEIVKPLISELIEGAMDIAQGLDYGKYVETHKDAPQHQAITTEEIVKPLISELVEGAMDIAQGLNYGDFLGIHKNIPQDRASTVKEIVSPLISELIEGAMDIAQGLNCGEYVEIHKAVPQERSITTEEIVKPLILELVEGAMDVAQGLNYGENVEIHKEEIIENALNKGQPLSRDDASVESIADVGEDLECMVSFISRQNGMLPYLDENKDISIKMDLHDALPERKHLGVSFHRLSLGDPCLDVDDVPNKHSSTNSDRLHLSTIAIVESLVSELVEKAIERVEVIRSSRLSPDSSSSSSEASVKPLIDVAACDRHVIQEVEGSMLAKSSVVRDILSSQVNDRSLKENKGGINEKLKEEMVFVDILRKDMDHISNSLVTFENSLEGHSTICDCTAIEGNTVPLSIEAEQKLLDDDDDDDDFLNVLELEDPNSQHHEFPDNPAIQGNTPELTIEEEQKLLDDNGEFQNDVEIDDPNSKDDEFPKPSLIPDNSAIEGNTPELTIEEEQKLLDDNSELANDGEPEDPNSQHDEFPKPSLIPDNSAIEGNTPELTIEEEQKLLDDNSEFANDWEPDDPNSQHDEFPEQSLQKNKAHNLIKKGEIKGPDNEADVTGESKETANVVTDFLSNITDCAIGRTHEQIIPLEFETSSKCVAKSILKEIIDNATSSDEMSSSKPLDISYQIASSIFEDIIDRVFDVKKGKSRKRSLDDEDVDVSSCKIPRTEQSDSLDDFECVTEDDSNDGAGAEFSIANEESLLQEEVDPEISTQDFVTGLLDEIIANVVTNTDKDVIINDILEDIINKSTKSDFIADIIDVATIDSKEFLKLPHSYSQDADKEINMLTELKSEVIEALIKQEPDDYYYSLIGLDDVKPLIPFLMPVAPKTKPAAKKRSTAGRRGPKKKPVEKEPQPAVPIQTKRRGRPSSTKSSAKVAAVSAKTLKGSREKSSSVSKSPAVKLPKGPVSNKRKIAPNNSNAPPSKQAKVIFTAAGRKSKPSERKVSASIPEGPATRRRPRSSYVEVDSPLKSKRIVPPSPTYRNSRSPTKSETGQRRSVAAPRRGSHIKAIPISQKTPPVEPSTSYQVPAARKKAAPKQPSTKSSSVPEKVVPTARKSTGPALPTSGVKRPPPPVSPSPTSGVKRPLMSSPPRPSKKSSSSPSRQLSRFSPSRVSEAELRLIKSGFMTYYKADRKNIAVKSTTTRPPKQVAKKRTGPIAVTSRDSLTCPSPPSTSLSPMHALQLEMTPCSITVQRNPFLERLVSSRKKHANEPNVCELCDPVRVFTSKQGLVKHLQDEHTTTLSQPVVASNDRCSGCDRKYFSAKRLLEHMRTCPAVAALPSSSKLGVADLIQQRLEEGKTQKQMDHKVDAADPLAGDDDDEVDEIMQGRGETSHFASEIMRRSDKIVMRLRRANTTFRCTQCSAIFLKASDLEAHQVLHDKGYRCRMCPAVFDQKALLIGHELGHTVQVKQERLSPEIEIIEERLARPAPLLLAQPAPPLLAQPAPPLLPQPVGPLLPRPASAVLMPETVSAPPARRHAVAKKSTGGVSPRPSPLPISRTVAKKSTGTRPVEVVKRSFPPIISAPRPMRKKL